MPAKSVRSSIYLRITATIISAGIWACSFGHSAHAEIKLRFSSLSGQVADENYTAYGYLANDIVSSTNSLAASAVRWGHHKLNMDERSAMARAGYMIAAMHTAMRFQWANSLYFGHEFSHFATAHDFGRDRHYFRRSDSHERISFVDAYLNTVTKYETGGPAVSRGILNEEQSKRQQEEGITSTLAGVNWQMNYSEGWLRKHLAYGDKDVFDVPEFFLNRSYLMTYAYGDEKRVKKGDHKGDVAKWANHMNIRAGHDDALKRAVTYGLISNMLSPHYWIGANAIGSYIAKGAPPLQDGFFQTAAGGVTWDIPQYLNLNSMTIAPTLYWRPTQVVTEKLRSDRLLLGLALETPVIGDDLLEFHTTLTGSWGDFDADFRLSASSEGQFAEIEVDYNLNERVALTMGAAIAEGNTVRAQRNLPYGAQAYWAGVQFTF